MYPNGLCRTLVVWDCSWPFESVTVWWKWNVRGENLDGRVQNEDSSDEGIGAKFGFFVPFCVFVLGVVRGASYSHIFHDVL